MENAQLLAVASQFAFTVEIYVFRIEKKQDQAEEWNFRASDDNKSCRCGSRS